MDTAFFLGANSSRGFYSLYDELIDTKTAETIYILKGCPGCGKSSLMKRVATQAKERGFAVERIYCSSDPDSLDGIILPELGKAIVDGTAPHVVEPSYPLAVERYINLGQFADSHAIRRKKALITDTKDKYSAYFSKIYRLTSASGRIDNALFDTLLPGISMEKLHMRAHGIIKREFTSDGAKAQSKNRFLSAISPKGYVTLFEEIQSGFSRVISIEDTFGFAHFLLSEILQAAMEKKYSVVVCRSPLNPDCIEHILIPELSLAFVSSNKIHAYGGSAYKKIHIDAMISKEVLKENKKRISKLVKIRNEILNCAYELLAEAKLVHDELEDIYNPHIRFDDLYEYADMLCCEILTK